MPLLKRQVWKDGRRRKKTTGLYRLLLTLLARCRLPGLTGRALRLNCRVLRQGSKPAGKGRWVLLLTKPGFTEDMREALSLLPGIEAATLRRGTIKAVARAFLPPGVDDNNYRSAPPEAKAAMKRYRAFLVRMWPSFDPAGRIGAVSSGNFGYFAEREWANALEMMGIPFVVLHKENIKSPGRVAFWERVYRERRGPFGGRNILVYNEIERNLMIRAGVVAPERVSVTGMPRLDRVHHWRLDHAGRRPKPLVLFFSFLPETGMPVMGHKGRSRHERFFEVFEEQAGQITLSELCAGTHRAMRTLAENYPDISVVIKTKGRPRDRARMPALLGIAQERELPANLAVVHGGSPWKWLRSAAAVCGFNSTALLEALAAGKPVVLPAYAEAADPEVKPYALDLGDAARYAASEQELVDRLGELARTREPIPRQLNKVARERLRYWLGNDDGRASARTAAEFQRLLT